jgi:uncharacterized protein
LWLLLFSTAIFAQKSIPPVSDRLVSDYANVLSAQEEQALEQKLVAYDDSSSTQIAVVIENSLDGDDLFDYSQRLAESWGIGREGKSNGVLIYVAVEDRKVRIHTGYGVEGFLPDALASRIIRNLIVPEFRNGNYYAGLDRATDAIIELGKGEYTNDALDGKEIPIGLIIFLIILVIVVFIIISKLGGGGGYYRGGRYDNDRGGGWIIFGPGGGGWHSGGSGGSGWGGGGGFGGFGGGGFGGGGASGGW